ncbi:hypothetical protein GGR56DRAFT_677625 [Xylariaceae sp. FL0804]|nr:hypothetical protein GGR56DRAFT_677625 [Xylariaceae sp. FL0804]
MRFISTIVTLALSTTVLAAPEVHGRATESASELLARGVEVAECPCTATESCGCNAVVAGSWCYCLEKPQAYPAAPCASSESCGCNSVEAGSWGFCMASGYFERVIVTPTAYPRLGRSLDSAVMRTIAVLTLALLPATFPSAIFLSMSSFGYDAAADAWAVLHRIWLY